jgi:hypothetical protein
MAATKYFRGGAPAVAQVATAEFGTYDVATARTITIGGVAISRADSGGTLTAALTALAALLNASTHPYFAAITWTSNATKIIGTADVVGAPFVFAGSVAGGTGTLANAYTVTTASAGPNDWSTAANWSDFAVPVSTDTAYVPKGAVNVCWGLDQSAVTLAALYLWSLRGGLRFDQFTTDAAATVASSPAVPEYRGCYLQIGATIVDVDGASRWLINLGTVEATVTIRSTAGSPADTNRYAVGILANKNTTDLYIREAPGGVGIAAFAPGETSTVRHIVISTTASTTKVATGDGVTFTDWKQAGGTNLLRAAATVTLATVDGGEATTEGTFAVTTMDSNGGTIYPNSTGTITALTIKGRVDFTDSRAPRTVTTPSIEKGGELKMDASVVTLTNKLALPSEVVTVKAA